jgi:lipoprotein-anchoring transpeptidase ErfK/SrfK
MNDSLAVSRRLFIASATAAAGMALAGCSTVIGSRRIEMPDLGVSLPNQLNPMAYQMYAARNDDGIGIPAVNLAKLKPGYARAEVSDPTGEKPGTIVVATSERYLYLVQQGGRAIRYGVGVGRDGFRWSGRAVVGRKATWPTWTPPPAMQQRQPETREFANGMPGGINNPLGARALYIYKDGRDTIYRLHGTPETYSIGTAVSSGCVRLINQDIIDLYARCPVGTPIVVEA